MTATAIRNCDSRVDHGIEHISASAVKSGLSIEANLCETEWDEAIRSHSEATVFHTTAWARVLAKTYGHRFIPFRLSNDRSTVALIPMMGISSAFTGRRGIGMPFSDFCEPLVFADPGASGLVNALAEFGLKKGWRYFELRGGRAELPATAVPAEQYYGHRLDLTGGIEQLFSALASPVRRAIRKAQTSGLSVEVKNTAQAVKEFYRLHIRTRKRHGAPPQPFSFFNHIQKEILDRNLGFIVTARRGTNAIASAVFLSFGRFGLFKFGASDPRHQELRANNLVMWQGIQELVQRGIETLHFGRTDFNNDGLRRFKLAWGTKEETIEYFKFDVASNGWMAQRGPSPMVYRKVFRSLPLAANRVVGAWIYPHLD